MTDADGSMLSFAHATDSRLAYCSRLCNSQVKLWRDVLLALHFPVRRNRWKANELLKGQSINHQSKSLVGCSVPRWITWQKAEPIYVVDCSLTMCITDVSNDWTRRTTMRKWSVVWLPLSGKDRYGHMLRYGAKMVMILCGCWYSWFTWCYICSDMRRVLYIEGIDLGLQPEII